ncbi:unnamed protein product [Periconia digitata]|uniref:Uncharacterized protein n=1 Tax=Periconia digitata TaxID=1303443 RepID=A0A9W4XJU4_9PLEO|nr:unnamed protein product [Periconia digitata]
MGKSRGCDWAHGKANRETVGEASTIFFFPFLMSFSLKHPSPTYGIYSEVPRHLAKYDATRIRAARPRWRLALLFFFFLPSLHMNVDLAGCRLGRRRKAVNGVHTLQETLFRASCLLYVHVGFGDVGCMTRDAQVSLAHHSVAPQHHSSLLLADQGQTDRQTNTHSIMTARDQAREGVQQGAAVPELPGWHARTVSRRPCFVDARSR